MITKTAQARWNAKGPDGHGIVGTQSGALDANPYSFAARFGGAPGATNPEELLAAAHASCYAMSLGFALEQAGLEPEWVKVGASVTLGEVDGGFLISGIHLEVEARVPDLDRDSFEELAEAAKTLCPLSMALHAVPVSVDIRRAVG